MFIPSKTLYLFVLHVVFLFFYQPIYTHGFRLKKTDAYLREAVDCRRSVNEALYIHVVLAIAKYQKLQRACTCYIKNITLRALFVTFSIIHV
jgi:inner membrane protein involved in colicin E2 resistance